MRGFTWLCLFLGPFLLAAPSAHAGDEEGGQVLARDHSSLEDRDYRFRLARPATAWDLLPEERIQEVSPDAIAGAHTPSGVWGAIIVERAPGLDLEAFRTTIFENLGLEEKVLLLDEATTLGGQPAWRLVSSGVIGGVAAYFRHVLVAREGFVYQIVSWAPRQGARPPAQLEEMEKAFSFLDGPVRPRTQQRATRDMDGVGWRIRSGAFESAAFRMRVEPVAGWRLVVGSELREMNDDAEVGLQHVDPECYMVVIPELFASPDASAISEGLRRQMREGFGEPTEGTTTFQVMGTPVQFERYEVNVGVELEFWHGVLPRGQIFYQFLAWQPISTASAGREAIARGLQSLRYLDDTAAATLTQELDVATRARSAVGPNTALRHGRYQDFASGFTFTVPPGYWRVQTEQEARAVNEDASLAIEDPERGLMALVIVDRELGGDAEQYHDSIVASLWEGQTPPGEDASTQEKIGETLVRSTAGDLEVEGLTMWYRVFTLMHRGTGIQIHVFGHRVNRALLDVGQRLVLKGFEFPAQGPEARRVSAGAFEDHRLGFRFRTRGTKWRLSDQTPEHLAGAATILIGKGESGMLMLMGLQAVQEGQDENFFLDLLREGLEKNLKKRARVSFERSDGVFAGQAAVRLSIKAGDFVGHALLVQRGQLTYMLMHGREDGEPLDPDLESRLEFLP